MTRFALALLLAAGGCNLFNATCGNGIVDPGEQCDDGNTVSGDGCRQDCSLEGCNDGSVDPNTSCYTSSATVAAGAAPAAVALADFNGDSHNDLAVANQNADNVVVLLN